MATLFSGCLDNQEMNQPTEQISEQISESVEENKIMELETKIYSLQQQINELQTRINKVDLLNDSEKKLIPRVPFKIEVYSTEWQAPLTYLFKENGMEIRGGGFVDTAHYELFSNNNTIIISSKTYDYYGLVLYDDYVATIYENGWIGGVHKYRIIPPKYNSQSQKYELN